MRSPSRSSRAGRLVPAVTFVAVLLLANAATLRNPALLAAPSGSLRDGSWAHGYQSALDAASPLRPGATALWNALDLALFGQAPNGVVLGAGGWLFTAEEYVMAADPAATRSRWWAGIAGVATHLERDGVRLAVALVPAKARLVAAGQPPLPRAVADRYDETLERLRSLGVDAIDLRPRLAALGDAAWLRTDTHWTPAGATAAAETVAAYVLARSPDLRGTRVVTFEPLGPTTVDGDLVALLALGPWRSTVGPPPDVIALVRPVVPPPATNDLFATVELPVTLVGTSFSADPRWGLAVRLEASLGVEILDASEIGRGPGEPMATYLAGEAYRSTRPRWVVWEIPERYLDDTALEAVPVLEDAASPETPGVGARP